MFGPNRWYLRQAHAPVLRCGLVYVIAPAEDRDFVAPFDETSAKFLNVMFDPAERCGHALLADHGNAKAPRAATPKGR
jgi:hypothetical protein